MFLFFAEKYKLLSLSDVENPLKRHTILNLILLITTLLMSSNHNQGVKTSFHSPENRKQKFELLKVNATITSHLLEDQACFSVVNGFLKKIVLF